MVTLAKIEKMQRADVRHVMEIERQSFSNPWHESAYLTEITNPHAHYIVAKVGDDAVGYSGMWVIADESHITTIAVDPANRGKKIGEQLLIAMLEEASRRGARRVTLEVREHNEVAKRLYLKYGFISASIRRGYYTDNGENAIVMTIYDILSPSYRSSFNAKKMRLLEEAQRQTHSSPEHISQT